MRKTMSLTLLGLSAIVACHSRTSKPTATTTGAVAGSSAASTANSTTGPTAVLVVQLNKLDNDGDEITESLQTFEGPDAALIAEKVKSLDWQNPKFRPAVSVGFKHIHPDQRDAIQRNDSLFILGGLLKKNADGLLRATWRGSDELLCSPPLRSLDEAIALLVSFRADDGKWRAMVQWTKQE